MRILFMGTPDFALKSLEAIYDEGYNIIGVVTNVDKPKGRGMQLIPTPVKEFALEKNIKVYQPAKVRNNPEFLGEIKNLQPDLICVVAYGKILPQELLDIPKLGCVNVHGSLLPEYRGAAPIQWAVLNGDRKTGVTTMFMNAGMDTGDIILKQETTIGEDETTGELWNRLKEIGGDLLVKTLQKIEAGDLQGTPQGEDFTLAPMLTKEMAKIDWKQINAKAQKSLIKQVCDYFNEDPNKAIKDISLYFKINGGTINKYIKQGLRAGWIDKEHARSFIERCAFNRIGRPLSLFLESGEKIRDFNNDFEAIDFFQKEYNIKLHRRRIDECISGERKSYKGFIFKKQKLDINYLYNIIMEE